MKTGREWLESPEKRRFDIAFASGAIPLAAPLALVAMGVVSAENRQPPLFWQERWSNAERSFRMPKVRTLRGAPSNEPSESGHRHARALPYSQVIRSLHVDEIPQMLYVASGTMSTVGPRGSVRKEIDDIERILSPAPHDISDEDYQATMDALSGNEQQEWRDARRYCKPGLVNPLSPKQHTPGFRNDLREVAEWDIWYFHHASKEVDGRIIADTARAVMADVARRGLFTIMQRASRVSQASAEEAIEDVVLAGGVA